MNGECVSTQGDAEASSDSDDDQSSEPTADDVGAPSDGPGGVDADASTVINDDDVLGGDGEEAVNDEARDGLSDFLDALPEALCSYYVECGLIEESEIADCPSEVQDEIVDRVEPCDALVAVYAERAQELSACLSGAEGTCESDDIEAFCPSLGEIDLEQTCPSTPVAPADGTEDEPAEGAEDEVTEGSPTSSAARAVGAWSTVSSNCQSGTDMNYAYFLCPGGRIRGAGEFGNLSELVCGTYTTIAAAYPGCDDQLSCFDGVSATVTSTVILGGETDVASGQDLNLYLTGDDSLLRGAECRDGSTGLLQLKRASGELTDDYCVSDSCPADGAADGGYGSCGTDCDCGRCWYCESGECRYGGEGPYGCYRGCSG
jgi:hypothetical protein